MSAPPAPPPSYNESMQQGPAYPGAYQQSYGAVPGPPPPQASYGPKASAPPPGPYQMPPPAGSQTHTSQNVIVHPPQSVVVVGGCPACRVGVLEEDFTCCGVLLAILFFPIGILCCLALRQRRCAHCGAVFG